MKKSLIILIIGILSNYNVNAQNFVNKITPDYYTIQYAGYVGFLSVSAGKSIIHDRVHTGIQYGHSPASITGKSIHTISIKNTLYFRILHYGFYEIRPTINASVMCEPGQNSELIPGKKYPKGYYMTNSFNFPLSLGISIKRPFEEYFLKSIEYSFELCTLGRYLYYYASSMGKIHENITSLALSVKFQF